MFKTLINATQQLGRALMLPIAVLPVAGLLLRLGQPDLLDAAAVAAAGDAIFSNLGLLFAIGVAVGLARENHGAAGLAAVVGFLVATKGAEVLLSVPPEVVVAAQGAHEAVVLAAHKARQLSKLSVPIGILSGVIAGMLYNRYSNIKLPSYLAFFAGRRFVPIAAGCAGLLVAMVFGYGWPLLEHGMDRLSHGVIESGSWGLFVYGVLNRVLIITGLHHILNNVAWFLVGDFGGVTGDLKRFFAGDPSAGMFMSGFFPVMMFGLPAACLAMYHTALPQRRRETAGLLMSMGLTSFLTGVTEPIEFTFMFLAPFLYVLHALLTGTAMVVMHLLDSRLGFSFSAGLFDYVLNFRNASHPLYLVPVGAVYFALYYGLFRYFIVRLDLKTPGREMEDAQRVGATGTVVVAGDPVSAYIVALGGAGNLLNVDACTTRLRLRVANVDRIDEPALRRLGARGVLRLSSNDLQVVVGPIADQLAGDIRTQMTVLPAQMHSADQTRGNSPAIEAQASEVREWAPAALLAAALGGAQNITHIELAHARLLLNVRGDAAVDEAALAALGVRGIARLAGDRLHLLHPQAETLLRPRSAAG
ncbi:MAG: N-acetylglucosamine-specific PTS transporter subunit IIBC [Pseudomonadota bacterium]|nr:N-acetylglucosamine-specific PTS transporter subunit IIBC [Pseudomonadota bacterium]